MDRAIESGKWLSVVNVVYYHMLLSTLLHHSVLKHAEILVLKDKNIYFL